MISVPLMQLIGNKMHVHGTKLKKTSKVQSDEKTFYKSGKVGINANTIFKIPSDGNTYPDITIGLMTFLTPGFALRPGVIFYFHNAMENEKVANTGDYQAYCYYGIGGGIDLLFFIHLDGNLSLYFSAGGWYWHLTNQNNFSSGEISYIYNDDIVLFPLKFGGQFLFTKNFGFYADIGVSGKLLFENYKLYEQGPYALAKDYNRQGQYIFLTSPSIGMVLYFN